MYVEFAGQPELGIWETEPPLKFNDWVIIRPTTNTPDGLKALAHYATISVRRTNLRKHTPTQKETLF